jgi:ankyrin repeat protein
MVSGENRTGSLTSSESGMGRYLDTELYRETRNASCSVSRVHELIAAGANVNRRHSYGCTPLWNAASQGRGDVVAVLLSDGADPSILTDDGSSPLLCAARQGLLDMVRALLDRGTDPNSPRDSGYSTLVAAISGGHSAIVGELIAAGVAIDSRYLGRTMIEYAEWCKQPEIATLLRRGRRHKQVSARERQPDDPS